MKVSKTFHLKSVLYRRFQTHLHIGKSNKETRNQVLTSYDSEFQWQPIEVPRLQNAVTGKAKDFIQAYSCYLVFYSYALNELMSYFGVPTIVVNAFINQLEN